MYEYKLKVVDRCMLNLLSLLFKYKSYSYEISTWHTNQKEDEIYKIFLL